MRVLKTALICQEVTVIVGMLNKKRNINSNNDNNYMKVTVIPIVIGEFSTVNKRIVLGLEGLEIKERIETIQIIGLLRSARILRKVHSVSSGKPLANVGVNNFQMSKIIMWEERWKWEVPVVQWLSS